MRLRMTLRKFRDSVPMTFDTRELQSNYTPEAIEAANFLELATGVLRRQCYVNFEHTYDLPLVYLMPYHQNRGKAFDITITKETYVRVMGMLREQPHQYLTMEKLKFTATERLAALA